jgi:hypothetical protein
MLETLFNLSIILVGVVVLSFMVRLVDSRDNDEDLGYRDDEEL